MYKLYAKSIIQIFICFLLLSCSIILKMTVYNNTEEWIIIHTEEGDVQVLPGGSATFNHPRGSVESDIHVSTNNCEYYYMIPSHLDLNYASLDHDKGVELQLEKNWNVTLLVPSTSGDEMIGERKSLKINGFPHGPTAMSCRTK